VFIWREFKGAGKNVNVLLGLMFILFISGLVLIILSGGN
jgi:glucose uptake protein